MADSQSLAPSERQCSGSGATETVLPALRQDLLITSGGSFWTGAPSWLIHDPVRNRYFRIGREVLELLGVWRPMAPARMARSATGRLGRNITEAEIENLAKFLVSNSLVQQSGENAWRAPMEQFQAGKQGPLKALIHNYLFFKIPLVRPQKMLDAIWPAASFLFTRSFAILLVAMAALSLYLVSRQWDDFTHTFLDFLSFDGFLLYGASLIFIKVIHEMGHALMATKYRVEVPVMGAALILLMPILYTDTTSAYRLKSTFQRLQIDLAGIYAELALAVLATLFWVFLPEGPMRSVAFATATLSWVMSIAVNLNPFMRFDGYYILSDLAGFENLQERGFALARWRMREILFRIGEPPPELLPAKLRRLVILHAWGTWIYRFFLFLGIALIVYAFFIKLIGIMLFVLEILWYIVMPVFRELNAWWSMRAAIVGRKRSLLTGSTVLLFLLIMFVPWSKSVSFSAIMKTGEMTGLFAPQNAILRTNGIHSGMAVKKGQVLAVFESAELDQKRVEAQISLNLSKARLARSIADPEDQSLRLVLDQEVEEGNARVSGLEKLAAQLLLMAPSDGTLVNADRELHAGLWVSATHQLALLKPDMPQEIIGVIPQAHHERIAVGNPGWFYPDNLQMEPVEVQLRHVDTVALAQLDQPYLAESHGGTVPLVPDASGNQNQMVPRGTWFRVDLAPMTQPGQKLDATVVAGKVILKAEKRSIAAGIAKRVLAILLREFGI